MTDKPKALESARRAMRQLSATEQDKLLEQYLSDGIAADKARIAELEECMKYARTVMSVTARSESISQVCHRSLTDEIARIDAALSQPKERNA